MRQVRPGSATITHAVRAATQRLQASLSTLSQDLGINPNMVAKWRKRSRVEDLKTGPKAGRSGMIRMGAKQNVRFLAASQLLLLARGSDWHLCKKG